VVEIGINIKKFHLIWRSKEKRISKTKQGEANTDLLAVIADNKLVTLLGSK